MTTAIRLTPYQVQARSKTGAPRLISVGIGETSKRLSCQCPNAFKSADGCSHMQAVRNLVLDEAAQMAQGVYVGNHA